MAQKNGGADPGKDLGGAMVGKVPYTAPRVFNAIFRPDEQETLKKMIRAAAQAMPLNKMSAAEIRLRRKLVLLYWTVFPAG